MVKVEIIRSVSNGEIISYVSEGHANYDGHGKDIVCSTSRSLHISRILLYMLQLGIVPDHTIHEGFLKVDIPEQIKPKTYEQVQLLLESMVVMLKSIEESYGEYLKINKTIG